MPNFVCLGEKIVNLDHIAEVEWVMIRTESGESTRLLNVIMSGPAPQRVEPATEEFGSAWSVTSRHWWVAEDDPNAMKLWAFFRSMCVGHGQVAAVEGQTDRAL